MTENEASDLLKGKIKTTANIFNIYKMSNWEKNKKMYLVRVPPLVGTSWKKARNGSVVGYMRSRKQVVKRNADKKIVDIVARNTIDIFNDMDTNVLYVPYIVQNQTFISGEESRGGKTKREERVPHKTEKLFRLFLTADAKSSHELLQRRNENIYLCQVVKHARNKTDCSTQPAHVLSRISNHSTFTINCTDTYFNLIKLVSKQKQVQCNTIKDSHNKIHTCLNQQDNFFRYYQESAPSAILTNSVKNTNLTTKVNVKSKTQNSLDTKVVKKLISPNTVVPLSADALKIRLFTLFEQNEGNGITVTEACNHTQQSINCVRKIMNEIAEQKRRQIDGRLVYFLKD